MAVRIHQANRESWETLKPENFKIIHNSISSWKNVPVKDLLDFFPHLDFYEIFLVAGVQLLATGQKELTVDC